MSLLAVLLECASEIGLDTSATTQFLQGKLLATETQSKASSWSLQDVSGVSFFHFERPGQQPVGFSGALPDNC